MVIKFNCHNCGGLLSSTLVQTGKNITCNYCGAENIVPAESENLPDKIRIGELPRKNSSRKIYIKIIVGVAFIILILLISKMDFGKFKILVNAKKPQYVSEDLRDTVTYKGKSKNVFVYNWNSNPLAPFAYIRREENDDVFLVSYNSDDYLICYYGLDSAGVTAARGTPSPFTERLDRNSRQYKMIRFILNSSKQRR